MDKENRLQDGTQEKARVSGGKSGKRRHGKLFWLICGVLLVFILPGLYFGLTIQRYEIVDERLAGDVRIALVTDLHSCYYGKGQEKLISAIDAQKPDVILLGGDIFDDKRSDELTEEFLAGIEGRYPCYYVTGNHECWAGGEAFRKKMEILKKYGIQRLTGDMVSFTAGDATIRICGVDDPDIVLVQAADTELSEIKKSISPEEYTVLLAHRPEFFETYVDAGFDLVLAGHAHGGQWRIPGILNGLYAPNQGLFPKYAGGLFQKGKTTMIVSRGLARESTPIPRFYDAPELVIIELKKP